MAISPSDDTKYLNKIFAVVGIDDWLMNWMGVINEIICSDFEWLGSVVTWVSNVV